MTDVVMLSLGTGDLVVGERVSEDKEFITLEKPRSLVVTQGGAQFIDFMLGLMKNKNEQYTINKNHVVVQGKPRSELLEHYKNTCSPIQTVEKPSLVLPS